MSGCCRWWQRVITTISDWRWWLNWRCCTQVHRVSSRSVTRVHRRRTWRPNYRLTVHRIARVAWRTVWYRCRLLCWRELWISLILSILQHCVWTCARIVAADTLARHWHHAAVTRRPTNAIDSHLVRLRKWDGCHWWRRSVALVLCIDVLVGGRQRVRLSACRALVCHCRE